MRSITMLFPQVQSSSRWAHRLFAATSLVLLAGVGPPRTFAQSLAGQPVLAFSSSVMEDALPDLDLTRGNVARGTGRSFDISHAQLAAGRSIRPFSRFAIGVTAGIGGIGLEFATPLADHFNLRASGSYFSYYTDFSTDGIDVNGRILTRSANVSVDYFPFHNGFRLSPGVTLDNGNAIHGTINIPPGQSFSLGDDDYTSAAGDPVTGSASLSFGNRIAPSFTTGWGNLIPRSRKHFSMPFEIGFQYIGAPLVNFNLQGTACDQNNNCGQLQTDPTSLANEQQQRNKINKDLYSLRFYPILNLGFGLSF
jgi:hypothetical protein